MVQNQITVSLGPYVLPLLFECRVLHTTVRQLAVLSAILATAWLLVTHNFANKTIDLRGQL